jgi:shikimate kinase
MGQSRSVPRRLFLLGLMGAGKSTIGHRLSIELEWPYLDNDRLVLDATGQTPAELGQGERGREKLHAAEHRLITDLTTWPEPVIAGIPASAGDRSDLLVSLGQAGVPIYLRAQVVTLIRHVAQGPDRPWWGDIETVIAEAFLSRDQIFRQHAVLTIDIDNLSPEEISEEIRLFLLTT